MSNRDLDNRPWQIANRRERMRYLIRHFVQKNEICVAQSDVGLLEATSAEGQSVIPVWPDAECYENSCEAHFGGFNAKVLDRSTFVNRLLDDMAHEEYLAVFPNSKMEYEILEPKEFKDAVRFFEQYGGA